MDRYNCLAPKDAQSDDIARALGSLSLDEANDTHAQPAAKPTKATQKIGQTSNDLLVIIQAMRKIREGLVASARIDTFARDVYVFNIRTAILTGHMESYHPALLHLLYRIHPIIALPPPQWHEFVGYHILDLACRQADLSTAYAVRYRYTYNDSRVDMVLKAVMHGNWHRFWNMREELDAYQKKLLEWADSRMRKHALDCLGRTYLKAEVAYVEKITCKAWVDLREQDRVPWNRDGDMIIIRPVQRR